MQVEDYSRDLNQKYAALEAHAHKLGRPVPSHLARPTEDQVQDAVQPSDTEEALPVVKMTEEEAKVNLASIYKRLPELLTSLDAVDGAYEWDEACEEVLITGVCFVTGIRNVRRLCCEVETPPDVAVHSATLCCAVDSLLKKKTRLLARQAQQEGVVDKQAIDVSSPQEETCPSGEPSEVVEDIT